MSHSELKAIVSKLKVLNLINSQYAMDEIGHLIDYMSIRDLAEILEGVYREISAELKIDWRVTAMQWKIGNRGLNEFSDVCSGARFKVWSFPFRESGDDHETQQRYTTCLPFQFKPEAGLVLQAAHEN